MAPNNAQALKKQLAHRGMALIAVLWITAALGLLAMSLSQMARTDVRVVNVFKQTTQAQAVADGALNVASDWLVLNLAKVSGNQELPVMIADQKINVYAVSNAGFININVASPALIHDLFVYGAGLDDAQASVLANNIMQWRNPPTPETNLSNEAKIYQQAGLPPPRHALFVVPEDVRQVLGVTPDIYARIAPLIDTSTKIKSSLVDPAIATSGVLLVLAKGNQQVVQQIMQARREPGALAPIFNPSQYPGLTPQFIGRAGSFIFRLTALVPRDLQRFWARTWWVDFSVTPLGGAPWQVTQTEPVRAVRTGDEF